MNGKQFRTMIVDDEPDIVELIVDILNRSESIDAEGFTSPLMALEKFIANPENYHMLITDFLMPKMDGVQLARRMNQIKPNMPVVLITGCIDEIEINPSHNIQIQKILMKPFLPSKLVKIIHTLANSPLPDYVDQFA